MRRKLISIGVFSLTLTLLITFSPIWERYPGGRWNVLIFLFIVFLLFWLLIKLIKEIIRLIKDRKTLRPISFLPVILILVAAVFISYTPDTEDTIYGKVTFRACYEGTLNGATFKLREGNRFELHWTGVLFADIYFRGTYRQAEDTLFLDYYSDRPTRFGDKILMDNKTEQLITIRQENDSLKYVVPFYYGYCKGLN